MTEACLQHFNHFFCCTKKSLSQQKAINAWLTYHQSYFISQGPRNWTSSRISHSNSCKDLNHLNKTWAKLTPASKCMYYLYITPSFSMINNTRDNNIPKVPSKEDKLAFPHWSYLKQHGHIHASTINIFYNMFYCLQYYQGIFMSQLSWGFNTASYFAIFYNTIPHVYWNIIIYIAWKSSHNINKNGSVV